MNNSFPIVVLISGGGSNLQAIIDTCHNSNTAVEIRAVISNNADAYGLQRAQQAGIATEIVPASELESRDQYDLKLLEIIDSYQPKLVVLAGFMRILSESFVNHYQTRLINIHPSLLPKFRGLNTHQRAIDEGVTEHGATVHFVTYELDSGPSIVQSKVPVYPSDDKNILADRVLEQEHIIYPLAINWIAEGRLVNKNNHLYFDQTELAKPLQHPIEPEADSRA